MHNPILSIFEALAVSSFPNKEDLRIKVLGCIKSFISYFDIDQICDFDVEDRKQVAEFAGLIACDLYFTNIKCGESLTNWLNNSPLKKEGQP